MPKTLKASEIESIETMPVNRAIPPLTGCYFGSACFTYSLH